MSLANDFIFLISVVNEVLGDHNVDKQMTDSRGEVCMEKTVKKIEAANRCP